MEFSAWPCTTSTTISTPVDPDSVGRRAMRPPACSAPFWVALRSGPPPCGWWCGAVGRNSGVSDTAGDVAAAIADSTW